MVKSMLWTTAYVLTGLLVLAAAAVAFMSMVAAFVMLNFFLLLITPIAAFLTVALSYFAGYCIDKSHGY